MNKSEIYQALKDKYIGFIDYLDDMTEDEYDFQPENRWSPGQQAVHLIKSIEPMIDALSQSGFLFTKKKLEKSNRASRSYQDVIDDYIEKLADGGVAPKRFHPGIFYLRQRKGTSENLRRSIERLAIKVDKWSEEDLDKYLLPHPILGKITIREMLYFTIHHAQHHQVLIKHYLKGV